MTHDEFMSELTRQTFIWRMAKSKTMFPTDKARASATRTTLRAEDAINTAVLQRASSISVERARLLAETLQHAHPAWRSGD
jgi:hypothetical protein